MNARYYLNMRDDSAGTINITDGVMTIGDNLNEDQMADHLVEIQGFIDKGWITSYGGNGTLRTDDRMCNFCREITAFRVFERTQVIDPGAAPFEIWKNEYRQAFYDRFGFKVPPIVPQTNDVRNPSQGDPVYEACVP